ncbi:transposase domain-containing protein [Vreelandella populi]|uniref:transposase domain-containing protein n=1 Tax=Vreelandella populi TaxID=2498858 RepID=UPI003BF5FF9F
MIETAKANGLESDAYIHHILEHIAPADMLETLKALLPRHVDFEAITKKSGVIHG